MTDVNGDNRDDLILQYNYGGSRYWQARLSTGSSFAYNGDWTSTTTPGVTVVGVADVNGDNRDDLILQY
ncbi:VCBS repeat-containing protein [Nostoc sp. ChiQUE01b]|uniref:FG-GAP repeat domain-containing protein n=1 Tax=Nostoc sp. ChiQUE01b TaxID=3075376 RepID=UPI002AD496DF|nr:VCBS repeat-containing protein [Nostoc sp. ChiQUE01b]MDZ8260190.1 VCBS repeat-containing protein [Nostoc sp. ChiQUE01b]